MVSIAPPQQPKKPATVVPNLIATYESNDKPTAQPATNNETQGASTPSDQTTPNK